MRRPRLYLPADLAPGRELPLPKDRAHYLRHVLRLNDGAGLVLFDGQRALDFQGRLRIDGKRVRVQIESVHDNERESPLHSRLIQAAGKPERVDWLVQKTTELGLRRLTLFNAERTQTPLRGARRDRKLEHWQAVAASACEQCGRSVLPLIEWQDGLHGALDALPAGAKLMLDFDGAMLGTLTKEKTDWQTICFLVGPEGGLNPAERQLARNEGFLPWRLGPRVLRMETAAAAALSLLQDRFGDFG